MRKVYTCFLILFLCLILFSSCTSVDFDLLKNEEATNLSITSKSSNDYEFNTEEYIALNKYLSKFIRTGYMQEQAFNLANASESELLRIAQLYCVLEKEEELEFASYANSTNCRISESALHLAAYELFQIDINAKSTEKLFYQEGYYYWNSEDVTTINSNFALINNIETMGKSQYSITFTLYNNREETDEADSNKFFSYSHDRAIREFPRGSISDLNAIVNAPKLSDTGTMQLTYMQRNTPITASP